MSEIQTLDQAEFDINRSTNFAPCELALFKEELDKQFAKGDGVNIFKALYIVRYLAMLDKSFKQLAENKSVTFTDAEWNAFVEAQVIFLDAKQ